MIGISVIKYVLMICFSIDPSIVKMNLVFLCISNRPLEAISRLVSQKIWILALSRCLYYGL